MRFVKPLLLVKPVHPAMESRAARHLAVLGRQLAPQATAAVPQASPRRLLEGYKVVELATVVAAPGSCAVLADLGADVLKIENPADPDTTRGWIKGDDPNKTADPIKKTGSHFTQLNRGKRAMALNYHSPEGLRILKQLMAGADVFVTNVRNQSLKKLGLDYESVSKELPQLVYAHLSAWGRAGPRKDDPGYDAGAFWAYSGLMELHRSDDDASMPRFPWSFGDNTTSMQLVAGIALALLHRNQTGEGQLVDAALMRSGIWVLSHPIAVNAGGFRDANGQQHHGIRSTTKLGERRGTITFSPFRCKDDRWVQMLGMETGRHWEKTMKALGIEGQIKLSSKTDWREAMAIADKAFATKTYAEWHEIFKAADVWHCPINQYEDLLDDEQANAAGAFAEVPGLQHKLVKAPFQLSSQAGKDNPQGPAPSFGEHTSAVLASLGYTPEDEERLRLQKVVK
eukprot:CAMPEP_0171144064 /NCGR_PEP_ID=MMETSP0766_2-20121228/145302_1 /TAXON_ID=439317 /ORGANISM="Gambierdiscus australes, Strain CAWD 149" /LENGTH=454 /DNA_ID=CAMNT_0011607909 /DNA_START=6 /DNA_END=1370 /DNA_ORIENTATION=+